MATDAKFLVVDANSSTATVKSIATFIIIIKVITLWIWIFRRYGRIQISTKTYFHIRTVENWILFT